MEEREDRIDPDIREMSKEELEIALQKVRTRAESTGATFASDVNEQVLKTRGARSGRINTREWPLPEDKSYDPVPGLAKPFLRIRFFIIAGAVLGSVLTGIVIYLLAVQAEQIKKQNEIFSRQNSISVFEQTSRLKDLLYQKPTEKNGKNHWQQPDQAAVAQIVALGKREPEIMIPALISLLRNENPSISVGAFYSLRRIQKGVNWMRRGALFGANLKGVRLTNVDLSNANLNMAFLDEALLFNADLRGASLRGASLKRAHLEGASLEGANLEGVSLEGANLRRANLQGANLKKAMPWVFFSNIKGVNFLYANIYGVENCPIYFREIALAKGAVELPPDEWEAYKKNGYKFEGEE